MAIKRYVSTLREVAGSFGITPQAVAKWVSKGMPPPTKKGYDLEEIRSWLKTIGDARRHGSTGKGDIREKKIRAEIRKIIQEERFKRLKNDKYESKLVSFDEVYQRGAKYLLRIAERLEAIPEEMQVLAPSECRSEFLESMKRYIFELKTEMSGWSFTSGDD